MSSHRSVRFVTVAFSVVVAGALVGVPRAADAQVVRQAVDTGTASGTITLSGVVRDSDGRPLEGADVRVGERHQTLTDGRGTFLLRGLPFDTLQLLVRRVGFEPAMVAVAATDPGVRVELAVTLVHNAVRLGTIVVEGTTYDKHLWDTGYYRRARVGYGKFFDPDYMERFAGASLGTLMRVVPRIDVGRVRNEEFVYGRVAGAACRMNIFLDGQFARYAMPGARGDQGIGIDQIISRHDVHAVEVYPTINSVPPEFMRFGPATGGSDRSATRLLPSPVGNSRRSNMQRSDDAGPTVNNDAACGAVVIWTKPFMTGRLAADSAR